MTSSTTVTMSTNKLKRATVSGPHTHTVPRINRLSTFSHEDLNNRGWIYTDAYMQVSLCVCTVFIFQFVMTRHTL